MSKEQETDDLAELEPVEFLLKFYIEPGRAFPWPDEFPQVLVEPPELPCRHLRIWDAQAIRQRLWAALLAHTNIDYQKDCDSVDDCVVDSKSN